MRTCLTLWVAELIPLITRTCVLILVVRSPEGYDMTILRCEAEDGAAYVRLDR